jgi:hypothetical protein
MASVQCPKEFTNLGSSDLPHDQSIRSHPERLADQVDHADSTHSLHVRRSPLEVDTVTVAWSQLPDVLDDHDAIRRRTSSDEPPDQGGLSCPGAADHEMAQSCSDDGLDERSAVFVEHAQTHEPSQTLRGNPGDAQ